MSDMLPPLFCAISCIGFTMILIGGVIALIWINQSNSQKKRNIDPGWKLASGRVTGGRLEEAVRTHFEDDDMVYPLIQYSYIVDGTNYSGQQGLGGASNHVFKAKKTLAAYPPGREVGVFYNPEKPEESRLSVR